MNKNLIVLASTPEQQKPEGLQNKTILTILAISNAISQCSYSDLGILAISLQRQEVAA